MSTALGCYCLGEKKWFLWNRPRSREGGGSNGTDRGNLSPSQLGTAVVMPLRGARSCARSARTGAGSGAGLGSPQAAVIAGAEPSRGSAELGFRFCRKRKRSRGAGRSARHPTG